MPVTSGFALKTAIFIIIIITIIIINNLNC